MLLDARSLQCSPVVRRGTLLLLGCLCFSGPSFGQDYCPLPSTFDNYDEIFEAGSDSVPAEIQEEIYFEAQQTFSSFLTGEISADEKDRRLKALLDSRSANSAAIIQTVRLAVAEEGFNFSHPRILSFLAGEELSPADRKVFERLGIESPEAYLLQGADAYSDLFMKLVAAGATYKLESGWDLTQVDLGPSNLSAKPELQEAIAQLISPQLLKELLNEERRHSLVIESNVILPPRSRTYDQRLVSPILHLNDFERELRAAQKRIQAEAERFQAASKKSGTYSNLMRGRVWELFGGERGHEGKTAPEIERDDAWKSLNYWATKLDSHYGLAPEQTKSVRDLLRQLGDEDRANIESGISKLNAATAAAIAAPFVPIAIYGIGAAGAVAGGSGAGSALLTGGAGTATASLSAKLALAPILFQQGLAFSQAGVDTAIIGGNFGENLLERQASTASQGVVMAPFLAALPVAFGTGAVAIAGGSRVLKMAHITNSSIRLRTAYTGVQAGIGVGMMGFGGVQGVLGARDCYRLIQQLHLQAESGISEERLDQISANTWNECIERGFDMADALLVGGVISHASVRQISSHMARRAASSSKPHTPMPDISNESLKLALNVLVTSGESINADSINRLAEAEKILRSQESFEPNQLEEQLLAVMEAHQVGQREIGRDGKPAGLTRHSDGSLTDNWTFDQLRRKIKVLREAGIQAAQREDLVREGHVGLPARRLAPTRVDRGITPDTVITRTLRDGHQRPLITQANVESLFAYELPDGSFGAKAIAYRDSHGKTRLVFWNQGQGRVGNNVHHRDALASAMEFDGELSARYSLRLAGQGSEAAEEEFNHAFELIGSSGGVSSVRNADSFPEEVLRNSIGLQFQAARQPDGSLKIVGFSIDSSITAAQMYRDIELNGKMLSEMLSAAHEAFDPELRAYTQIGVHKSDKPLLIDGNLELPIGHALKSIARPQ